MGGLFSSSKSDSKTDASSNAADNSANAGTNSSAESFAISGAISGSNLNLALDRSTDIDLMSAEEGIAVRGRKNTTTQQGDDSLSISGKGKSRNAGGNITETTDNRTQRVNASGGSTVTIQDGSEAALLLANRAVEHLKTAQLETINATRSTIERVTSSAEKQSETAIKNLTDNKADPLASNNIKVLLIAGIAGVVAIVFATSFRRPPSNRRKSSQ